MQTLTKDPVAGPCSCDSCNQKTDRLTNCQRHDNKEINLFLCDDCFDSLIFAYGDDELTDSLFWDIVEVHR